MSVGRSACSLCLSDQCCGGYLSWTAAGHFPRELPVLYEHHAHRLRQEKQTWTRSIGPLLFKYSGCFSDASQHPWTQRHSSVNMSFSHTLAYFHPAKSKQACLCLQNTLGHQRVELLNLGKNFYLATVLPKIVLILLWLIIIYYDYYCKIKILNPLWSCFVQFFLSQINEADANHDLHFLQNCL